MISRNSRTVRTALVAAAAAAALVLSACGGSSDTGASSAGVTTEPPESVGTITAVATATTASAEELSTAKSALVEAGSLTVCTSLPYPPFESSDIDGKIIGFDIDLMDELSKDLGVTTKIIDTDFTGIKSGQAMTSGICDISAAAMTINPERQAVIQFSDPYYSASQALLVKADSSITGLTGMSGKKMGAQAGTTGKSFADLYASQYGYTVVEYTNITEVEAAVNSGNVDAGIHDDGPLFDYVNQQAGAVKIAKNFKTGEQYGFGAALGNTALIAVTNAMLKRITDDGTFKTIQDKWIKVGS